MITALTTAAANQAALTTTKVFELGAGVAGLLLAATIVKRLLGPLFRDRVAELAESVVDPEWDRERRGLYAVLPVDAAGGDGESTPSSPVVPARGGE